MLSLDLVGKVNVKAVKSLNFLKPRELCYIRVSTLTKFTTIESVVIAEATKYTSMTFVSFPIEDIDDRQKLEALAKLGIKGVALRASYEEKKFLHHDRRGPERSGDLDLIKRVSQFRRDYPDYEVVVEFQLRPDMRILAPTIAHLHEDGMKWVVLNVEGEPDKLRISAFREIFEYLRIRGCTFLNVYFPFWDQRFREWDIKTQNTFSGLYEVHIDISNRCTHSCVFCGLYGPAANEDIKKDNHGQLGSRIIEFMKMEMDTERCLWIIESLPWSVKVVQFGGAGDPMMHKDALKFIKAVRERGFQVGILTNMEYFEEEDLLELHSYAGRPWELHIDANVSAGTPEMYTQTRPRQTEKNFNKVVHNLQRLSELRERDRGVGVYLTLMCVVTMVNYRSLLDVAKLAVRVGVQHLWFKPMELHATFMAPLLPGDNEMHALAQSLKEAVDYAESHGLVVKQRDYFERIFDRSFGKQNV
jgi:MoaA/NifB/PqqE/SkfB family radical SAM enzyme